MKFLQSPPVRKVLDYIEDTPRHILTLRLTALFMMFYPMDKPAVGLQVLGGIMLFYSPLLTRKIIWVFICIEATWYAVTNFYVINNHEFLILYWCYTCLIAVSSDDPDEVLAWNARMLVGITFTLAVIWKLIVGKYLDGSFLYFCFLLDERFDFFISLIGDLSVQELLQNRDIREAGKYVAAEGVGLILNGSHRLRVLAFLASYWVLFIESALGLCFIFARPKWFDPYKNILLLIFVATTYLIVPLTGFALILNIYGFATCPKNQKWLLLGHLFLFLMIPFTTHYLA